MAPAAGPSESPAEEEAQAQAKSAPGASEGPAPAGAAPARAPSPEAPAPAQPAAPPPTPGPIAAHEAPELRSASPSQPAPPPRETPVTLAQLPVAVSVKALEGATRFEIRLEPAELGRVDVRLDIDPEGAVKAHLIVERPEALQLLRRDAHALQQALSEAGLKADSGGLSFGLRQENPGGHAAYRQFQPPESEAAEKHASRQEAAPPPSSRPWRGAALRPALDLTL
jgi:flagellar hook-length control protein FliK